MTKRTTRLIKWIFLILSLIAVITFFFIFSSSLILTRTSENNKSAYNTNDNCLYHIIITGTYENQSFLTALYNGASKNAERYNSLVELVVPQSQADMASIQSLLDYSSYLNVDGIIAYIDSPEDAPILLRRFDEPQIPIVTTGQFAVNVPQISYIGINNWEFGKKIAEETESFIPDDGNVFIINTSESTNSLNLISSLQSALLENSGIKSEVIPKITPFLKFKNGKNVFITLTEEETIASAQILAEQYINEDYTLIGYGGNEVCQLYLQKGWIHELFSLKPEEIGEAAMKELFEYRNKGHANSYITADVRIGRTLQ